MPEKNNQLQEALLTLSAPVKKSLWSSIGITSHNTISKYLKNPKNLLPEQREVLATKLNEILNKNLKGSDLYKTIKSN